MDLKHVSNKYRPLQMWSWNEKLNRNYTAEHIKTMSDFGFGGFCINARGGLENKYMGDEWFRNIALASEESQKSGMEMWACDENGAPSGSGNGIVFSKGLEFQQKYLRCEAGEKTNDRTIIYKDGYHFYYDVNPYYTDILNIDATNLFIDEVYSVYAENHCDSINGFFSSNPRLSYDAVPWSFTLPAEYKNAYGEELLDVLLELFRPVGNYKETRLKFWTLITHLFSRNFLLPIYKWCTANGKKYAALLSDRGGTDFTAHGSVMTQYEYMHVPCIEVLSPEDDNVLMTLMASSITQQLGKEFCAALLFPKSGHSATFNSIKHAAQLQLVRGINRIWPAFESSSLRGVRKRTNSTASYLHESFRDEYIQLNEYISRTSMILSEGKTEFDTLLIHNGSSLWECYGTETGNNYDVLTGSLFESIRTLEKKHIPFHIGDELIMQKHAYVDGDCLCIGKQKYKNIVLPENTVLLESTTKLLAEFEHGGGFIAVADSLSNNDICDNENLIYTTRSYDDFRIHYFVNNSNESFTAAITSGSKIIDMTSGDISPFYGIYKFSPFESIAVIDDFSAQLPRPFKKPLKTLSLDGNWDVSDMTENVLSLDKCDVYFDGDLVCENENIADVTELTYKLNRPVNVECVFKLNVNSLPENAYLAVESYSKFVIRVNNIPIEKEPHGYFIAEEFTTIDVAGMLLEGENLISLGITVSPTDEFTNFREKAFEAEAQLSRITYDVEFEPLYIIGDFSVKTDGEFRNMNHNACRFIGNFTIDAKREQLTLANLEQQGLPFFFGQITLTKTFNLSDTQYCIDFLPFGINSIRISINGTKLEPLIASPYKCDISSFLQKGDNKISITLINNMRNLFGPHHVHSGELRTVNAGDFYKHSCIWNSGNTVSWNNNYCFIKFGIKELD